MQLFDRGGRRSLLEVYAATTGDQHTFGQTTQPDLSGPDATTRRRYVKGVSTGLNAHRTAHNSLILSAGPTATPSTDESCWFRTHPRRPSLLPLWIQRGVQLHATHATQRAIPVQTTCEQTSTHSFWV
jgi:hypothetical protein